MEKLLFTSESVTEGHPDKLCDAVSDAILDACMEQDPMSRVACETASCTGFILVTGEITTKAQLDIPAIVRKTALEIGYDDGKKGLDGNSCAVMVSIDKQSADIAMGVDKALEAKSGDLTDDLDTGAGDQGMMFGYATNETEEYMPYPIALAHKLAFQLTKVRKDGTLTYLRPDGKTQVSVEYDEAGKPVRLEAVVLSTQHDEDVTQEQIHEDIKKYVFDPILPKDMIDAETKFFINPTGRFVIGGPHGDAGLTGRKIIVDTYGGYARHGGGAFSGKDCTKVDRSAAYAARYAAKNVVAAGLAKKCEIQLSYAIGVAQPTSIAVDTFGTGKLSDTKLVEILRENFDFRPAGIIKMLDLRRPIYKQTAAYGHFGRNDLDLPWEKLEPVPCPHQLESELSYTLPSEDALDDLLKEHRMIFLPSRFCKEPNVSDKINANEAEIVVDMLRRIHRFYGDRFDAQKTVGVIVPYRNQIAMVRKGIEKLGIPELEKISIDTVERYQGSQRDVIIYSFTIQNIWQLDFLAGNSFVEDGAIIDRKLNVAITRARKQMIMTGYAEILRNNQIFSQLMDYVKEKRGYFQNFTEKVW